MCITEPLSLICGEPAQALDKQATTGDTSATCGTFGLPPPLRETGGQTSFMTIGAGLRSGGANEHETG